MSYSKHTGKGTEPRVASPPSSMSWSRPEVLGEVEDDSGVEHSCADDPDVEGVAEDGARAEEGARAEDPDVDNVDDAVFDVRSPKSGVGQSWQSS